MHRLGVSWWRGLLALLIAVLASQISTTGPAATAAAPGKPEPLTATPTVPVQGQQFTLRGRTPTRFVRQVEVQRKVGATWRTVGRSRSGPAGHFRLARTVWQPVQFRAIARPVTHWGAGRWTSRPVWVRPRAQTVGLSVADRAEVGAGLPVSAVVRPIVVGRVARLQLRVGGAWVSVAMARTPASGVVRFSYDVDTPGTQTLRVLLAASGGRPAVHSAARAIEFVARQAEPEPDPEDDPDPTSRVARIDITTVDGTEITSKEDYLQTTLTIRPRQSGLAAFIDSARLRVRGNSTAWISQKLPYKIKLDQKARLIDSSRSKDWVLLANFYDRSLLRNDLAFEVSRRLGLDWTPNMVPVEVWQNGNYQGLYQLGEGIEVEDERVDLDLDAGEFLLEADSWPDDDTPSVTTTHGLQVFVKEPDVEEPQRVEVEERLNEFEAVLYGEEFADPETGYRSLVDVGSFVDWFLVNEVMKNIDSSFLNSCWMVIRNGRIGMGPVWDFDQSAGNRRVWDVITPEGWLIRRNWNLDPGQFFSASQIKGVEGHWLNRMFEDPWFVEQVAKRWSQVREELATLPAYVAAQASVIAEAAERNYAPPPTGAGLPLGPGFLNEEPEHVFQGSWVAEAEALQSWIQARVAWLDEQLH